MHQQHGAEAIGQTASDIDTDRQTPTDTPMTQTRLLMTGTHRDTCEYQHMHILTDRQTNTHYIVCRQQNVVYAAAG